MLVGLSVVWIPIMNAAQGGQLWQYWQMLMSAVGPPWAMVFIFGVLWKRTTEPVSSITTLKGEAFPTKENRIRFQSLRIGTNDCPYASTEDCHSARMHSPAAHVQEHALHVQVSVCKKTCSPARTLCPSAIIHCLSARTLFLQQYTVPPQYVSLVFM